MVGGAAQEVARHEGALEEQVEVVLPREADAAVDLDVELGAAVRRRERERRGHRRRQRHLIAILVRASTGRGTQGVPHETRRELGVDQHVGAVVLDRLEGPDHPTELLTLLRVARRLFGAGTGDAHRFGGEQRPTQIDQDVSATRDHLDALRVWIDCDGRERARRVAGRDGHALEEALAANLEREASERARYLGYYGIDLTDLTIYDLVLDSTATAPEAIVEQVVAAAGARFA